MRGSCWSRLREEGDWLAEVCACVCACARVRVSVYVCVGVWGCVGVPACLRAHRVAVAESAAPIYKPSIAAVMHHATRRRTDSRLNGRERRVKLGRSDL